jgi:hypothetical protein
MCLWLYRITQVQAIEEGDYRRAVHFHDWFLWAVLDSVLDPKLTFSLMKLGSV